MSGNLLKSPRIYLDLLRLKIDLVSYPSRAEGLGKYGYAIKNR